MNLTEACFWSAGRALVVALVALPFAWQIAALLRRSFGNTRRVLLAAMLIPILMPELLVGFVYSETTLRVVRYFAEPGDAAVAPTRLRLPQTMDRPFNMADAVSELLYAGILLLRFAPIAGLVAWLAPGPQMSAESIHCRRLLPNPGGLVGLWRALDAFARGPFAASLPAFAVVFLLVFQEFEIASLMQISRSPVAWTVWLFDNHAGGLMLSHSLSLSVTPVVCEVLVVGGVLLLMLRGDWHERESVQRGLDRQRRGWVGVSVLAMGLLVVTLLPVWRLRSGLGVGLRGLLTQSQMLTTFLEELTVSLAFGLAAALLAWQFSGWLLARHRFRFAWLLAFLAPGLIGSLVLSLSALALFQTSVMTELYDTPIPMLLVLWLFLLPRAVLLRLVFFGRAAAVPVYTASLLAGAEASRLSRAGRAVLYAIRVRPAVWMICLLAYWGYWDLTVASILRPTMLEPFSPGLYNLMHYGRNETLAAMSLLAGVAPPCLVVAGMGCAAAWRTVRS